MATVAEIEGWLDQATTLIAQAKAGLVPVTAPPAIPPPPVVPPPVVPPTTGFGPWKWDARSAVLDPNSAAMIASWLGYSGTRAYLAAEVAVADTRADSPGYSIPGVPVDPLVYIPLGTKPGVSADHHLWVRDTIHRRETDLAYAKYDAATQRISGASFGGSFPLGAVSEPTGNHEGSVAALLPLGRGLIWPAEVAAGVIDHPLCFSCNNTGSGAGLYPSAAQVGGLNAGHLRFGSWLRLDPSVNIGTLGLTRFAAMVCHALQNYGMFLRDTGSLVAFYGADPGGGGQSDAQWKAAGLTLNWADAGALQVTGIPWDRMQLLQPPPRL